MQTTTLGMTSLEVSRIALGTWQLSGDWGRFDQNEAINAIRHARRLGINLFDTAQAYGFGASERLLGRALRDDLDQRRDEVIIATKGGLRIDEREGLVRDASPAWLRRGVDESLAALGVDHIDLYQVHWPDPKTPFAETAGALEEIVQEGKIRHVGVSNFSVEQIGEFAATRPVETAQPPYHLFERDVEADLLPYCREQDIGVLVYGPLAHGLLTGAFDEHAKLPADDWRSVSPMFTGDALERNVAVVRELAAMAEELGTSLSRLAVAWVLANPAVHVAIIGSRRAAHIEDSVAALDVQFDGDAMERIDRIMEGALAFAGPTPEGPWPEGE